MFESSKNFKFYISFYESNRMDIIIGLTYQMTIFTLYYYFLFYIWLLFCRSLLCNWNKVEKIVLFRIYFSEKCHFENRHFFENDPTTIFFIILLYILPGMLHCYCCFKTLYLKIECNVTYTKTIHNILNIENQMQLQK